MADNEKRSLPKGIFWGIAALIIIFIAGAGIYIYGQANKVKSSLANNLDDFRSGITDLKNLNPDAAQKKFLSVASGTDMSFGDFISVLQSMFGGTGDALSGFKNLASGGVAIAEELSYFENNLSALISGSNGEEFLSHLKTTEATLASLSSAGDEISAASSKFEGISPGIFDMYIPAKLDIARIDDFLKSLISWLSAGTPRHIFVMLQNPSEMRPAGGFLGSYADVAIGRGGVAGAEVHDINEIDRTLSLKTIPPQPLQALITNWRTADSNWFFDFPSSAAQAVKFADASKLYSASSTIFGGAIAISPQVLADILNITGPIELKDYKLTIDSENFLGELQKSVEQGQVTGVSYPKAALREFAAEVFKKLVAMDSSQKQTFISLVRDWFKNKDLMVYFADPDMEKFVSYYGGDGGVYALPNDFEGDYLAVANANIGGGKSDLFVREDVSLESQINEDGTVSDHLTIDRAHEGNKGSDWWYKTTNQDYLQVFVQPDSQLANFSGGLEKKIYAPTNYAKNGYMADDFVGQIDSSTERIFNYPAAFKYEEFGKEVFATWSRVAAGGKTELVFDYTHRLPLAPSDGQTYQFVFEKQAGTFIPQSTSTSALPGIGAPRSYKFTISAPVGYKFKENDLPVYEYDSGNSDLSSGGMPGRLIVNLTLEKI
ncbi:MAG: DUF4012 domain-containing protein [Patescibacteria group bacterium]|nr:DUF4012 domain-containing protein [Patescibacteria group bacterium]MDE2014964.1 DUF4012 domain-containing protein [Patescibacteria group bacterium]MDE2226393.1 DUF4012 domain-containing protein [Patescibacteria group bacterium]